MSALDTRTPPAGESAPVPASQPSRAHPAFPEHGRLGRLRDRLLAEEGLLDDPRSGGRRVLRQPPVNRLVHWLVALSTFSLFFSGFGQLPLYKRYMLSDVPGLAWTADYAVTLYLHYLGAFVLIFAVSFHLAYHGLLRRELGLWPRRGDVRESIQIVKAMLTGGQEPPSAKYLAEQRLAYLAIGGSLALLIVTGLVKVAKNLPGVGLPELAIEIVTHLHNLAAILLLLGVVGHLVALLIPANRKLVGGMFHGTVDREYVEHRHPIWYQELLARAALLPADEPARPAQRSQPCCAASTPTSATARNFSDLPTKQASANRHQE